MSSTNIDKKLPKTVLIRKFLEKNYEFYKDIILQDTFCRKKNTKEWLQLDDGATAAMYCKIDAAGISVTDTSLNQVLKSDDFIPQINPIKDYFTAFESEENREAYIAQKHSLENIEKLADLAVLEDETKKQFYLTHLFKFMVRCIRSVFEPKYFNKHALIFVGKNKSVGKSYFCHKLVPKPLRYHYYQPAIRLETYVDTQLALSSNFIVNLDEIENLTRTKNAGKIKAIVSQDKIKVRLSHARRDSNLVRIASFVGTCNEDNFLRSDLGSSRWVAIKVKKFKWMGEAGSEREREVEKLIHGAWREAYHHYRGDATCGELTDAELEALKENTDSFIEIPVEQELASKYFSPSKKGEGVFMTTTDIMLRLQEIAPKAKLNKIGLGRVLSKLGFIKIQEWGNNRNNKGYYVQEISQ